METVLFIAALLVANTIQGITGFAGNVIAMPPAAVLLGVDTARSTLNILALLNGLVMTVWLWKDIAWKTTGRLLAYMMPGIVIGMVVYTVFPADGLLVVYGAAIALIGVWYLRGGNGKPLGRKAMVGLVGGAGVIQGMFVSGGPLLVVYAVTVLRDKQAFRASLSLIWLVLNGIIFVQNLLIGHVNAEAVHFTLVGIIPMVAATIAGGLLQKRLNQKTFLTITYVLLIVSGIALVVRNFL